MRTTATNRKLRTLITGIRDKTLIPNPEFQRRLVWTNRDKINFLDTVLNGYPFPEIYIAAGDVNPDTGEGTEMLVDGQQRIWTLYLYFIGSNELKLDKNIKPYAELGQEEKKRFLEYEVVVRDLGQMSIDEIKRIFQKINATSYALNAMEIHNSRFDGEFKKFAEEVSQLSFFENHRVFSANEIRRMRDISFVLTFVITIMSTYFTREDALEDYLSTYNDEFELKEDLRHDISEVFAFIESCNFGNRSRVWKKSDLLTVLVEVHRVLIKEDMELEPNVIAKRLNDFYHLVDNYNTLFVIEVPEDELDDIGAYYKAAIQGTNDRNSRITRGQIIHKILRGEKVYTPQTE